MFFFLPSIIRTSLSPFPLPRCCKLDRINTIAQENGLISEEEMVGSVEHLVLGHFKREERDEYGVRTVAVWRGSRRPLVTSLQPCPSRGG